MWRFKTDTKFKNSFFPGLIYCNHNRIHLNIWESWFGSPPTIGRHQLLPLLHPLLLQEHQPLCLNCRLYIAPQLLRLLFLQLRLFLRQICNLFRSLLQEFMLPLLPMWNLRCGSPGGAASSSCRWGFALQEGWPGWRFGCKRCANCRKVEKIEKWQSRKESHNAIISIEKEREKNTPWTSQPSQADRASCAWDWWTRRLAIIP